MMDDTSPLPHFTQPKAVRNRNEMDRGLLIKSKLLARKIQTVVLNPLQHVIGELGESYYYNNFFV